MLQLGKLQLIKYEMIYKNPETLISRKLILLIVLLFDLLENININIKTDFIRSWI
jgi:hypothetical protein